MTESKNDPVRETAILGGAVSGAWRRCSTWWPAWMRSCPAIVAAVELPSYRDVCSGGTGHAEVVKIVFDPAKVSYRELLDVFFTIHDPTTVDRQGNDVGPAVPLGDLRHLRGAAAHRARHHRGARRAPRVPEGDRHGGSSVRRASGRPSRSTTTTM